MSEDIQNVIAEDEVQSEVKEPTIVQASETSHLRFVTVPEESEGESADAPDFPEVKLPKTLKATHEALNAARNEPDVRVRRHKTVLLTNHLHALSQGTPAPAFTHDSRRAMADVQNRAAEEMQIEMLGRQFPVVKKWIDRLTAENKSLSAELAALKNDKK